MGTSPYAEITSAMNEVTDRWSRVISRREIAQEATLQFQSRIDPELKAVNDYLSGRVPEKGSNVVALVSRMTF